MGGFTAPFTVLRLLIPLNISDEAAKRGAEPYPRIIERSSEDATGDRGSCPEGCRGEPPHLGAGQQSIGRECAVDHSGPARSTPGGATMIESSFLYSWEWARKLKASCGNTGVGKWTEFLSSDAIPA